ncbi:hypothetical protein QBC35DRAFT_523026 [Podospora australis]|uniref:Actin-like ATPase domain-containing protein n=1 Tax=Podospora australis TaxID=1536484 RepID=A0AAN6WVB4_9PEZI|nr:hypothetical protein QBC35DRAFT_523026 [Podospora australis]
MAPSSADTGGGDNVIIVGIDFGTTYSGVAFTWSNKVERMEVITSWESELHSNADMEKVPTALAYGPQRALHWGYAIPFNLEQLRWFKLLLIDEDDLPDSVRNSSKVKEAREYLKKHAKTPVEVVGMYLRHIWNHSIQRVTETVSRNLVNFSKFHIIITLPAIWPAYAQGRMREATSHAGMLSDRIAGATELAFLSEPEAAALATLSDMEDRRDIKANDSFVVVDCGGGTADLISYDMVSVAPMRVKECVKGQGDLCGAVFVDEAFLDILKEKFEWKFKIPFECLDKKELRSSQSIPKIVLTSDDTKRTFDPVVKKIIGMVDEQVTAVREKKGKDPKRLGPRVTHIGDTIEVLQSRRSAPWTAICRGAVIYAATLRGLSPLSIEVKSRVARVSYSNCFNDYWKQEKHDVVDKSWNDDTQTWMAKSQMEWFLKIGDRINDGKKIRFSCARLFPTDITNINPCEAEIYSSSAPIPPKKFDVTTKQLCTVKWDSEIDITTLPTFTNQLGKVFYELLYDVEMTAVGGMPDFAVYHNGKRQGSKHVIIDYTTK